MHVQLVMTTHQVAIFKGPGEAKGPVPNSQEAAQFDCIHLLRVMVKLLPTWLPDALFEVLQARWNSRQRLTRSARPAQDCDIVQLDVVCAQLDCLIG